MVEKLEYEDQDGNGDVPNRILQLKINEIIDWINKQTNGER